MPVHGLACRGRGRVERRCSRMSGIPQSWMMLMLIPRTLIPAAGNFMAFANSGAWLGVSRKGRGGTTAFPNVGYPSVVDDADADSEDVDSRGGEFHGVRKFRCMAWRVEEGAGGNDGVPECRVSLSRG